MTRRHAQDSSIVCTPPSGVRTHEQRVNNSTQPRGGTSRDPQITQANGPVPPLRLEEPWELSLDLTLVPRSERAWRGSV